MGKQLLHKFNADNIQLGLGMSLAMVGCPCVVVGLEPKVYRL